jgi:antitoxin StbD
MTADERRGGEAIKHQIEHEIRPNFSMSITHSIFARTPVSMTDLRRNPSGILADAGDSPIAVLNHNKPAAYLLSAKIVQQRRGGKTVKVKLEDVRSLWFAMTSSMFTPTLAGVMALRVAITEPMVAPLPGCTSRTAETFPLGWRTT